MFDNDSNSYFSQILNLGSFQKGEDVKLDIRVNDAVFGSFAPILAYLKPEAIAPHKAALTSGMESVLAENGHYVVKTNAQEDRLLIVTASYEDGWEAYVDGQKTEVLPYQDAFLSVPVSSGAHTVELKFTPPGWKIGLVASAAGVLLFAAVSIVMLQKKKESSEEKVEKAAVSVAATDTNSKNEEEKK